MRRMRVEELDHAKTENEWMVHSQHEQLLDIDGEGTRYGGCVRMGGWSKSMHDS